MAQLNIRIDDDLKNSAEVLFEDLGLNISTAVNMFIRQAVRQGSIPFEVTTRVEGDSKMQARKELGEAFRKAQEESVKNGTNKITMDEIDEIIAEVRRERKEKKREA